MSVQGFASVIYTKHLLVLRIMLQHRGRVDFTFDTSIGSSCSESFTIQ